MTKLSERIEACTGDTTELAAEMLTFVTGDEHVVRSWEPSRDFPGGKVSVWRNEGKGNRLARNPLTDERAIAALERKYLPEQCVTAHQARDGKHWAQVWVSPDFKPESESHSESLARSAALVRALEVSRD